MRVGIIGGTGPLGRGLAVRLAAAGTGVTVGSRDAERAAGIVGEILAAWPERALDLVGAANEEAAACDVVVVATPWDAAVDTAAALADALAGKVVVSVANALVRQGREMLALVPARGSVAEALNAVLPGSRLVAAGHHLPAATLADLDAVLEADVLVCADDAGAAFEAAALLERITGLRAVQAGSLASAGPVEAFTAVLVTVNMRYRVHSTIRLGGLQGARDRFAPAPAPGGVAPV